MDFDFTFADGTSPEQIVAFEIAGEMWSEYLADNMTVNIHVEMTNLLPENVIGGALPGMLSEQNYGDFLDAYEADITSWHDRHESLSGFSVNNISGTEQFEAMVDLGFRSAVAQSSTLNMTRANGKALGLIDRNSSELDGYILMTDLSDSSLSWGDYLSETEDENTLDFLSVAVHEVGHVLGFVSGVDRSEGLSFDSRGDLLNYLDSSLKTTGSHILASIQSATPMDMLRYSEQSLRRGTSGAIDMSIGAESYFGKELYYEFASGKSEAEIGDGFQASHWKQTDDESWVQGIMDPLMRSGIVRRVSNRDLKVMDAIGYDLTSKAEDFEDSVWRAGEYNGGKYLQQDFGIEIANLEIAAKNKLAQELYAAGKVDSVHWWSHGAEYFLEATSDRTEDVQVMIEQSQIYEGRRSRSRRSYSRQELSLWQQAYFSEFSWQELDLNSASSSVESFSQDYVVCFDDRPQAQLSPAATSVPSFSTDNLLTVIETEMKLIENSSSEDEQKWELDSSQFIKEAVAEDIFIGLL